MANDFIRDSSPSELDYFDFDFNSYLLNLVFDEPIFVNTLNFNEITIQSGSTKCTLTNGSVIDMIVDDQVTLQVMLHKVGILIATDTKIVIELAPQALADTSGNQYHM